MLLEAANPAIVFVELSPPSHEGLLFTRELRLSELACRKVPVIMLAGHPTETVIRASRDAGVSEFLRSPFNVRDLMLRVEAVTQKERGWIEAINYVGPDRRRFNSAGYSGPRKRRTDMGGVSTHDARIAEALKIMKAALDAIHSHPRQALRSLHAQAEELESAAAAKADYSMATGARQLKEYLDTAARTGVLNREQLAAYAGGLLSPTRVRAYAA